VSGSGRAQLTGALRRGVKATAALADAVRRPPAGITFLIYHRVGGRTPVAVDLPTALFDEQMAWLAARGLVLTIDDAVERLTAGDRHEPGVVVTFDDGTADLVDQALPVLVRHRVPATVYVATDFVDRQRPFPDDGRPVSWAGLGECVASGLVTIGSHTHTHALLDRLPAAQVGPELDRSIDAIGARLNVVPQHFAYPKALPGSPAADRAVRARFTTAALAGTRPNPFGRTDLHALHRSPLQTSDGMKWFEHKARGGLWAEDALRRVVNRRRYAGATT
jgi:peptidoglycan/xylan/chitin deacetylase (PgdA/CDA1 family)